MDLTQLANLGEFVGGVAVIASLLYLAFQIRQNTVHSRAYSQRDMLTEITGDILRVSLEPELLRRGLSDFASFSADDKVRFSGFIVTHIARFEANLRLYRSGLMDEVLFRAHRAWALSLLTTSGGMQWWGHWKRNFSEDIREYLDDAVARGDDLPAPMTDAIPFYKLDGSEALS